jgi:hypothetical protein
VAEPPTIRTANRLADNEGRAAVLIGLAVDAAGRRAIHLDRDDAIVPIATGQTWGTNVGTIVRAAGQLRRYADANDPATGLSSLELVATEIAFERPSEDGVIRTATELHRAEGDRRVVEGMAYRSSNGNILVLAGGIVYVLDLEPWTQQVVTTTVHVRGTVRHGDPPPEAPAAGGGWFLERPDLEATLERGPSARSTGASPTDDPS